MLHAQTDKLSLSLPLSLSLKNDRKTTIKKTKKGKRTHARTHAHGHLAEEILVLLARSTTKEHTYKVEEEAT